MAEKNSLWKNIRNKAKQNRRTGAKPKKPTAEMLRQEKIINSQYAVGGPFNPDGGTYANKQGVIMGPVENPDGSYTLPVSNEGLPQVNLPEFEVALESNPYGPVTEEEFLTSGFNPLNWIFSVEPYQQQFRPDGTLIPASGRIDPHYIETEFIGAKKGKKIYDKFVDLDADFKDIKNTLPVESPSVLETLPKSEINWANWNREVVSNRKLLEEYADIERQTKASGAWMKNQDGSKFVGTQPTAEELAFHKINMTPDEATKAQFIQQQSKNFKTNLPDIIKNEDGTVKSNYHNSWADRFESFDDSFFGKSDYGWYGKGVYTHPSRKYTERYGNNTYPLYLNSKNQGVIGKSNIEDALYYGRSKEEIKDILEQDYKFMMSHDNFTGLLNAEMKDIPAIIKAGGYKKFIAKKFEPLTKRTDAILKNIESKNLNDFTSFYNPMNKETVTPFNNYPKSALGNNGMFDMTNPNIYKAVVPAAVVGGAMQSFKPEQQAYGGPINPYMYYAGGPMQYKVGGQIPQKALSTLYGVAGTGLNALTFGATKGIVDQGYNALQKAANPDFDPTNPNDLNALENINKFRGIGQGIGAVGTALTGNFAGAAAGFGEGVNTFVQNTDASDDIKKGAGALSSIGSFGYGVSKIGSGPEGLEAINKIAPFANQAIGSFGGQSLAEKGQDTQDYLQSAAYLNSKAKSNQQYVNQGLSFAANGGNINNNSLNLQTDSMRNRYKKYKSGGSTNKFGVNFISNDAGIHDENSYGGVPIGPQSLAEGGEAVIYDNQGNPSYVMPDQVNGVDNMKDFTITSNGKIKYSKETLAKAMERKLNKLRGDSISEHTANQIKNEYISKRETLAQINAIEDTKKTVMEEYVAAYGGKLPNKYKGKVNMPSMKAKGGPMVSNIKQPFEVAAQNRGGMMMARGGNMPGPGNELDPEKLKAEGYIEYSDYFYNPKSGRYIDKPSDFPQEDAMYQKNIEKFMEPGTQFDERTINPLTNLINNSGIELLPIDLGMTTLSGGVKKPGMEDVIGPDSYVKGTRSVEPRLRFNSSPEEYSGKYNLQYIDPYTLGGDEMLDARYPILDRDNNIQLTPDEFDKLQTFSSRSENRSKYFKENYNQVQSTRDKVKKAYESNFGKPVQQPQSNNSTQLPAVIQPTQKQNPVVNSTLQVKPTNKFNFINRNNLSDENIDVVYSGNKPINTIQSKNYQNPLPSDLNFKDGKFTINPEAIPKDIQGNIQSLSNNDFLGKDADGNDVSINPDMYYKYQTGQFTPEGATLSPDEGFLNKALDSLKSKSAADGLVAAGQLAGPLSQFLQKRPKPFQYKKASATTVDPTAAIILSNEEQRRAQDTAGYNIKQNAPTSGSYLSNMRALGLGAGKQRGATAAGIKQQYDVNNAGILNQFEQFNTGIENANIDAMQQDQANFQEQRTNALYNAGANIAGMRKDYKANEINEIIANNIGTNNYKYDKSTNSIIYRTPDGQEVSVPVNQVSTPQAEKQPAPKINNQPPAPYSGPMANYLSKNKVPEWKGYELVDPFPVTGLDLNTGNYVEANPSAPNLDKTDTEAIKAFQDWMDEFYPNWLDNGKSLNKGKGYGNFGNQTENAWFYNGNTFLGAAPRSFKPPVNQLYDDPTLRTLFENI